MKEKVSMIQQRRMSLEGKPADEGRRMSAALSSTQPVPRIFGTEILRHDAESIDMTRASDGLPLLLNHDRSALPIGRVENVRLDDERLRGDLVFSEATEEARAAFALVQEGTLSDVSISYRIDDYQSGKDDQITVTRWMPLEASIVSVPADHTVGVGRSLDEEATPMPDEKTPGAGGASIIDEIKQRAGAGYQAGAEAERARLNAIGDQTRDLCRAIPDLAPQLEELHAHARNDSTISADKFRSLALELMGASATPLSVNTPDSKPGSVTAPGHQHRTLEHRGQDGREAVHRGLELAMSERVGIKVDADEMKGNQFRGWSLLDMARESLEVCGVNTRGMNSEQIAKAAIGQRAISPGTANYVTSDFPAVTENVITKRVQDGFAEEERVWDSICSTNQVPDFKTFSIPRISNISSLPIVAENAAYTDLTQVDAKESATLVKRGGLFSLSWEAMINDDASMFARTAARMGQAAQRTLDEQFFAFLAANGNMGDGFPLFDAVNHSNSGTAALDLAGIVATRTAMAKQTDENGILLNVPLRIILVPEELRDEADNLAGSEYLPWPESAPGAQRVNTIRSTFTVQASARLTDVNDWYGFARPGDTIECAFLNGNTSPVLERDMGWDTDAMHWKVRQPHIFYAVDWRGVYRNVVT